jgi:hypothetical protein
MPTMMGVVIVAQAVRLLAPALVSGPGVPPDDWTIRPTRGGVSPSWSVVVDADGARLRVESEGAAGWARIPIPANLTSDARLEWSWRVMEMPRGAALRERRRDDAPLRVLVGFGGSANRPKRAIAYTWGNAEPIGRRQVSHQGNDIWVKVVANAAMADGAWHTVSLVPATDFVLIWGRPALPITSIALMQDVDDTGERAIAELRRLDILPPPETP